jgi:hypothetical protein
MLRKIERSVFFPVARVGGFLIGTIFLITTIIGLYSFLTYDSRETKKQYVSFVSVDAKVNPGDETNAAAVPAGPPDLIYPERVRAYFSGDDPRALRRLEGGLRDFITKEQKQDFLNNLSDIIQTAEKTDPENVAAYIDEYVSLKIEKMTQGNALGEIGEFGQYLSMVTTPVITLVNKGAMVLGICVSFTIFIMVVLLLLLLSIERNTRKERE